MQIKPPTSRLLAAMCGLAFAGPMSIAAPASAADRTWIGGNADWDGLIANWNPADEPDADDIAIFTTPNTVDLANATETLAGLQLSGGIDLNLNSNVMVVDGFTILSDASTQLFIPSRSSLTTDQLTVNAGAVIALQGGVITLIEESGDGLFTVNGFLSGHGVINLNDFVSPGTTLLSLAGGNLNVFSTQPGDIFGTTAATMTINIADVDGRVDLDNSGGSVSIGRNDTLDINGEAHGGGDAFSGIFNLGDGSTLDMSNAWTMDFGTINANTGGVVGGTAGAAATITGGGFSMTGGTINLDSIDSLRFSATYSATGGTIDNNGLIIFDANATIGAGVDFQMNGADASITVNDGVTVNIDVADFNADGDATATNIITIGSGGVLDLDLGAGADESIGNTVNLNGGELDVTTLDNEWLINGRINVGADTGTSQINGETVRFANVLFGISIGAHVGANATLDINADSIWDGGELTVAAGGVAILDGDATFASTLSTFTGDGQLTQAGMLTVQTDTTVSVATFDWDQGTTLVQGGTFTVDVTNIDVGNDVFNNTITVAGSTLDVSVADGQWELGVGGDLELIGLISGAAVLNGDTLRVLTGGDVVVDSDAVINAPVIFDEGGDLTVIGPGTVTAILNGPVELAGGDLLDSIDRVMFDSRISISSTLTVTGDSLIDVEFFDWDGGGTATTTIQPGAHLTIDVQSIETAGAEPWFNGTLNMNGGQLSVSTEDDIAWVMDGTLNMNNATGEVPTIFLGVQVVLLDAIDIGNDAGTLDADLNVGGTGTSRIGDPITFLSDADVFIDAGATLELTSTVDFYTQNGSENAEFTGTGTLRLGQSITRVYEAVTLNMVGGTVDLDGDDQDINAIVVVDAPLTINAATLEDFGDGFEAIDIDNYIAGDFGALIVNLDDPDDEWTITPGGRLFLDSDGTSANVLFGSDVNLNGSTTIVDTVGIAARVDIGGTVNLGSAAGDSLTLNGGSLVDPNTLDGGTITGPGVLIAGIGHALHGHGSILTFVRFTDDAQLIAAGGILTLNRPILDVGRIGTLDNGATPTLDITLPWNTSVADEVLLQGGRLQGAAITNDLTSGIRGFGLVTATVENNTQLAADGGTLIVHDADWDGAGNNGALNALLGDLELTDAGAGFIFAGSVSVGSGREVFVNGFNLALLSGSSLSLTGGTYRSNTTQSLRGAVTANGGPSTLEADTDIASSAAFTLNGDLQLEGDTTVATGASFAGPAALVNLMGSNLTLDDGVHMGVLIENRGTLVLGSSPGQTTGTDFEQTAAGVWEVEAEGTGLNDFDRMNLTGAASIAGTLELLLGGTYTPEIGDTMNILSANGGVVGTFDAILQDPAMPTGVAFEVRYLPTIVQLGVVLSGDLNGDGYVGVQDLDILLANWDDTVTAGSFIDGDVSGDGLVGDDDLQVVIDNWGNGALPGGNVPEPGSFALMALTACALHLRRRRC